MSDTETIRTEPRTEFGSAASRRLRNSGMIPCLVYSGGKEAEAIAVETAAVQKAISSPHVIQLDVNGQTRNVLTQDAQWDYLANSLLHVDFKEIRMDQKITTSVPLAAIGEAAGVAIGGTLDQLLFEVEVECLPSDIPEKIEVDVSALGIGESITIGDAPTPKGVELVFADEHQTLFHVSAPRAEEEAAEGEEAEAAEAAAEDAAEATAAEETE